jgi:predicted urease superfamily metal-dependent hydrolase
MWGGVPRQDADFAVVVSSFVAQAADPGSIFSQLFNYGGVGLLAAAALWWARSLYQREVESYRRLEDEHLKLQESIRNEYVKTIVAATQAITSAMEAMADMRRERERERDK